MGGSMVNTWVRHDDPTVVKQVAAEVMAPLYEAHYYNRPHIDFGTIVVVKGDAATFNALPAGPTPPDRDANAIYISPGFEGWIGVHDRLTQKLDKAMCDNVTRELSGRLGTTAITFMIYDSDVLWYWLAEKGSMMGTYDSDPSYFRPVPRPMKPRLKGTPEQLAQASGCPLQAPELARLLHLRYVDAFDQLSDLGKTLGITDSWVCHGWLDLPPDELPRGASITGRDEYQAVRYGDLGARTQSSDQTEP